jgi:hypothetical protein
MNFNDLTIFPNNQNLATKNLKNHYLFAILKKIHLAKTCPKKIIS